MLKIDVYHGGSCARVRLHYHPYAADSGCGEECDYETADRAYHAKGESAAEYRKRTVAAVVAVLLDPAISHVEWQSMVGEQTRLML